MFEVAQIYCIERILDVFEIPDNARKKSFFSPYQSGFHL